MWMLLMACNGKDGGNPLDTSWNPPDDTGTTVPDEWTTQQIADLDFGTQTKLAVAPSGALQLVSWGNTPWVDGACAGTPRNNYDLYFAEESGGTWATEIIDSPGVVFTPMGLGLDHDSSGEPAVAYMGGPVKDAYCGGHDLLLAQRGSGWSSQTMATDSGQAATGDAASDSGYVVGMWPGLAFDSGGTPALAHRDTHFGTLQKIDTFRADLELVYNGYEAVDPGVGAGEYNQVLFDDKGRVIIVYAITVQQQTDNRQGVWAARQAGDEWEFAELHRGGVSESLDAGINPVSGEIVVAMYNPSDQAVRVRTLTDSTQFADGSAWKDEFVANNAYDEGLHVSLDFSGGNPALAYRRCKRISDTASTCDVNSEALVFALYNGTSWDIETVQEADTGSCGEWPSLAIDGGVATIAYRCTVNDPKAGFVFRPFVASRGL